MSEDHPLSLVEQVTPIIDLMARTSSHFARLRDFVTLKFPPGFPVKIGNEGFGCATFSKVYRYSVLSGPICYISFLAEIPLFHVLNARITFGSVNKCSTEAEVKTTPAVTPTSTGEDEEAAGGAATSYTSPSHIQYINIFLIFFFFLSVPLELSPFQVCPSVFEVPASYHRRGGSRHTPVSSNDEELLQYAIHQSLLESRRAPGQVKISPFTKLTPHTICAYHQCSLCRFAFAILLVFMSLQEVIWEDTDTDVMTRSRSDRWEQGMRLSSFKQFYIVSDKRNYFPPVILEASQRGR